MPELSVFSATYAEARAKFLDAARATGAKHVAYLHPREKGPAGEPLYLDVAVAGPADASRVLLAGSGTHGIEGYSGSAAQTAWLLGGGARRLPKDTAMVFFHAHNPWGFAHKARGTEENVDLNRNFLDHAKPYPPNPGYEEVHPIVTPRNGPTRASRGSSAGWMRSARRWERRRIPLRSTAASTRTPMASTSAGSVCSGRTRRFAKRWRST